MSVGTPEILVILLVALLVFGPQKLPEVGRQVGAAVRELRKMQDAVRGELDMVLHPEHGTRPDDAPTEPGDHTAGGDGLPALGAAPETSGEHDTTAPGSGWPDATAEREERFHGPPDSFI